MPDMRRIHLAPHLTSEGLEQRYRQASEPHERSWWQILWLLSRGQTAKVVADSTGYSASWIGQLAKRYNTAGPQAMSNRQHTRVRQTPTVLSRATAGVARSARRASARPGALERTRGGGVVGEWIAARIGRPVR
jgi:hypothetical protein